MPNVVFNDKAKEEFANLDGSVKPVFSKHIKKLETVPPRKFLKGSCLAAEIVGQGRIVCEVEGDLVRIRHVFATHKEYERWFKGGMVD